MDPITHGIAGALIGKAFFAGERARASSSADVTPTAGDAPVRASRESRVAIAVVTLGALFPDTDVIFNVLSNSTVATLEYHRWITHSVLCLPFFALALAAGTRAWLNFRESRQERSTRTGLDAGPGERVVAGIPRLTLLFGVGIASHIFLDVITSWGTLVWSPLLNHRTHWDWVFIIDGTLTVLLLLPQLLARICSDGQAGSRRALFTWIALSIGAVLLQQASVTVGARFSNTALVSIIAILAALIFGPRLGGWGARLTRAQWCRAGLVATAAYLLLCFGAQRVALARVEQFARAEGLQPQRTGALPLPPALHHWAGLVRTSAGVYHGNFSLFDTAPPQFEFVPDRATPESLEAARSLREVQTYLWFARFPVVETREEPAGRVVVFTDRRFTQRWASAPAPFEYWVVLDHSGRVLRHGWAQMLMQPAEQ